MRAHNNNISVNRCWKDADTQKFYDNQLAQRCETVAAARNAGQYTEARILEKLYLKLDRYEVEWEELMRKRDDAMHADLDIADLRNQFQMFETCFAKDSLKDAKTAVNVEKKEMEEEGETVTQTLVYGEIEFMPFGVALRKLSARYGMGTGGVFYDIGHGTGKPVLAAQLCHPFDKVGGVEIMTSLFTRSEAALERWNQNVVPLLPSPIKETQILLVHGDCLDFKVLDWSDATVLFANSTCFGRTFTRQVAQKAEACREGCFFINFTDSMSKHSGCWTLLEKAEYTMSWGMACVFISVRNSKPSGTPPPESSTKTLGMKKRFFCEQQPHHSMSDADSFDCVIC